MSTISDWIDLEDVKQFPLEGTGMRRESSYRGMGTMEPVSHFGILRRTEQEQPPSYPAKLPEREFYYSFSECIRREVPPHYREYYLNYESCKDLLRYLDAANNEGFRKGVEWTSTSIPLKTTRMLNDSLQSLLAAYASSFGEDVVKALVPQVRRRAGVI